MKRQLGHTAILVLVIIPSRNLSCAEIGPNRGRALTVFHHLTQTLAFNVEAREPAGVAPNFLMKITEKKTMIDKQQQLHDIKKLPNGTRDFSQALNWLTCSLLFPIDSSILCSLQRIWEGSHGVKEQRPNLEEGGIYTLYRVDHFYYMIVSFVKTLG